MARVSFNVSFELPSGASIKEAKEYVTDAVTTWRGSLRPPGDDDPGDPMFGLDQATILVRRNFRGGKR